MTQSLKRRLLHAWALSSRPAMRASSPDAAAAGNEVPRASWFLALMVTFLTALLYVTLIVVIDNTNVGTTNGLWKSPDVAAWEQGRGSVIDSGGALYHKSYGYLCRLLPSGLLQYGIPPKVVTFRKMAVLNGIFGAIASGFVCLLALRFVHPRWLAALVVLGHVGAGFVILNSLNSEDIIPAYAFFVGATWCFFEYLYSANRWYALSAAFFLSLVTLFHWTLMGPALAGYGAVCLVLFVRDKSYGVLAAGWFFLFLCITQFLLLLFYPAQHIPIWAVLLPAKSEGAGWVGLRMEKLPFLVVGMGNYFSGAGNFSDYRAALQGRPLKNEIASWAFLVPTIAICAGAAIRRQTDFGARCLGVFAIGLLVVGEAEALYAQPQDPQFQIQPMFATMAGLILLLSWLRGAGSKLRWSVGLGCASVLMMNDLSNLSIMRESAGGDSRAVAAARDLVRLFPQEKTEILCLGFEGWLAWDNVVTWNGDRAGFLGSIVGLAEPFTAHRGITGPDAASSVRRQTDLAFAKGKRVIASALWTETPDAFVSELATVADHSQAAAFESILRNSYRTGTRWSTPVGTMVELSPIR